MPLELMYITNDVRVAKIAEESGVDQIFLDLEVIGKEERQGHLDSVKSKHSINDVKVLKNNLTTSKLLVRVNPIHNNSEFEINKVVTDGADIVMLPFFKTVDEVRTFLNIVDGRCKTCLLLETPEAVEVIDKILELDGIDKIHIGLNDLHLGYGKKFMFELLTDGTVDFLCKKIKEANIAFGFGGIAQLGRGDLPAENIIAEHYRLKSEMVILSRSFCNQEKYNDLRILKNDFQRGVSEIRQFEELINAENDTFFESNKRLVGNRVLDIMKR